MADGLQFVADDFSLNAFPDGTFSKKSLSKGLSYFKEGYIHKLKVVKSQDDVDISGKCYRSMRKGEAPHSLHVTLSLTEKTVQDAYCSCTAGIGGRCSHMVGLVKTVQQFKILGLDQVPSEQSCTSLPQTWHIPRGNKISPVSINEVVVAKAKEVRKKAPITNKHTKTQSAPKLSDDQLQLIGSVESAPVSRLTLLAAPLVWTEFGQVPLGSVLSYQSQKSTVRVNTSECMSCGQTAFPVETRVRLPPWYNSIVEESTVLNPNQVEHDTRDQHQSKDWHTFRRTRLTASNMNKVVNRRKAPTDAMLKSIFSPKAFSTCATDYGLSREQKAKEKYITQKSQIGNCHLHECGLVINNSFPFIAATPDAKVCDGGICGILEVKCPYLARDMSLKEACEKIKKFVLCEDSGKLRMNYSHEYYVQIQGQLLVTGVPWCDLVVYTTKDFFVERIYPDISFMKDMLFKMALFYKYHARPYLQAK